jgi:hypothetical protein
LPIGAGDIGAPIYWRTEAPLRQYVGAPMSPAPSINVIILNRQCGGIIKIFKKRRTEHFGAPHLFSGQSPINWGITNRKRKYFSEKMTATLKSKQTSIATVGNHLRTVASLPTPLLFHYPLLRSCHLGPGVSRAPSPHSPK